MNTAILFSKIHLQGFVKHPDSEKAKKKKIHQHHQECL